MVLEERGRRAAPALLDAATRRRKAGFSIILKARSASTMSRRRSFLKLAAAYLVTGPLSAASAPWVAEGAAGTLGSEFLTYLCAFLRCFSGDDVAVNLYAFVTRRASQSLQNHQVSPDRAPSSA